MPSQNLVGIAGHPALPFKTSSFRFIRFYLHEAAEMPFADKGRLKSSGSPSASKTWQVDCCRPISAQNEGYLSSYLLLLS